MAVDYRGDNSPDGITIGTASTTLVSFHGVPPVAQGVYVPLTISASGSVIVSRVISLIAMLAAKGICASA